MSTLIKGDQVRSINRGIRVEKAYTPLVVETKTLFNVNGLVAITSIVGRVTTAITVANTVKLQANPTVGATKDLCAATDLGTTDSPAGNLISFQGLTGDSALTGPGAVPGPKQDLYVDTGTIEQVTATGADGGITWILTYVPIDDGATVVAA
ncbi:hypothetical protein [Umezawaea tangerina]|uniref:Uncharacterized protein n=1 Tax=Umezawaea tangerina TaxID=84725 RepID=A0A2T0SPK9_9PSEU|nr:hypothetical protein [Umezawaea tangerina]PRY35347.1 hypothetical protein CLV43_114265 [Umezawaea tangerina]